MVMCIVCVRARVCDLSTIVPSASLSFQDCAADVKNSLFRAEQALKGPSKQDYKHFISKKQMNR